MVGVGGEGRGRRGGGGEEGMEEGGVMEVGRDGRTEGEREGGRK